MRSISAMIPLVCGKDRCLCAWGQSPSSERYHDLVFSRLRMSGLVQLTKCIRHTSDVGRFRLFKLVLSPHLSCRLRGWSRSFECVTLIGRLLTNGWGLWSLWAPTRIALWPLACIVESLSFLQLLLVQSEMHMLSWGNQVRNWPMLGHKCSVSPD